MMFLSDLTLVIYRSLMKIQQQITFCWKQFRLIPVSLGFQVIKVVPQACWHTLYRGLVAKVTTDQPINTQALASVSVNYGFYLIFPTIPSFHRCFLQLFKSLEKNISIYIYTNNMQCFTHCSLLDTMATFYTFNQCTITSNGSWCMGIKGEMSGTVCVTFTWYMYIYELFIAFVCFVVCSLL